MTALRLHVGPLVRLAVATALLTVGCAGVIETPLPAPLSPPPGDSPAGLMAGFAVRDITPPPGVGMSSYAADSRQAVGFRQRLHVRAIVLEDTRGERLALVVADLGQISVLLQRRVAEIALQAGTGIGADRLVLSATHTHSGPGNYFEAEGLNANAGRFPGFDERVADFLVERIAAAVVDAANDLAPARAGWRFEPVWDVTFNRSYEAFVRNPAPRIPITPGAARPVERQAVDSTFAVLRVDRCNGAWEACSPKGGYAVFPIHATAIPAANNLFDADLHGVVARAVERHMREAGGEEETVFLLAQGAVGDVAPNLPDLELCRLYRFAPERGAHGPRTLPASEAWRAPGDEVAHCLESARRSADSLAAELGRRAAEVFDAAEGALAPTMSLSRAFTTLDLPTYADSTRMCWPPRMGAAALGGTEQGYIRTWNQRLLFFDLHFHEGGSAARDTPEGCFGHKKPRLGFMVEEHTLPRVFQLGVYMLGAVIVGAVPVEPTTETGALIRERLLTTGPVAAERALLVGLANGYALYVATAAEYAAQHYEGGATIYGPASAEALAFQLGELAAGLREGAPSVEVGQVSLFSDESVSHFWPPDPPPGGFERLMEESRCAGSVVSFRWTDLRPGTLVPADGTVARVERLEDSDWLVVADDASPDTRVRALEGRDGGYLWEVEWRPGPVPPGSYRVWVPPREGLPELVGEPCVVS